MRVVNRYIGVSNGYLGDFSSRTHADFYPEYCDLELDPYALEGTTRERFIHILGNATPRDQAKILRGVIARFPAGDSLAPRTRTVQLGEELLALAASLEGAPAVPSPSLGAGFEATRQHLDDAVTLIANHGAARAVDRVHTALHEFFRHECGKRSLGLEPDATLGRAFKVLREQHPAFSATSEWSKTLNEMVRRFGGILDNLNELRNKASPAHPNEMLEEAEAMLAVHSARTVLHYVHARIDQWAEATGESG